MMAITENIVPYIPESAPFTPAQRGWLNGYLAGLCNSSAPGIYDGGQKADTKTKSLDNIFVLFGSQTGNAESAAKKFSKKLKTDFPQTSLMSLDDYKFPAQSDPVILLILTSTYGEGEPPDNAINFVATLKSDDNLRCENIKYSIFGFGDSSYPDFNACAKFIDETLASKGGVRLCPSVFSDVEFESELEAWKLQVSDIITKPSKISSGVPSVDSNLNNTRATDEPIEISKKNPYTATVIENYNLNNSLSAKQTQHVSLEIDMDMLPYQTGDALGVIPQNCPDEIRKILDLAKLSPEEEVVIHEGEKSPLQKALTEYYDIHNLRKECISALEKLDRDGPWIQRYPSINEMRLVEILELTGIVIPTGNYLTSVLKPIQPRLYSISSSPDAHKGQVHVTVGVVSYNYENYTRKGLCSNYLKGLEVGKSTSVYIHANSQFKLPDDPSRDLIMIGPGTGIAPFRGFLHHRRHSAATGKNWLFFGDQKAEFDFLYKDEIMEFLESGHLTKLCTAFSRDQAEKIYVQNRIKENASELVEWIESGAYIYVCGDASRMAKDVECALLEVIGSVLGKSPDESDNYLKSLKSEKRYLRDVY